MTNAVYNTLKCVETLGNIPSLIFKTLGQLENVAEPCLCSMRCTFTTSISFHSMSLEILSSSLHSKQAHVSPKYLTSKKIKGNHQYEQSSMETKGMAFDILLVFQNLSCVSCVFSWIYSAPQESGNMMTIMKKKSMKKFSFYLWLFLRKRNGLCKQMLEIVIFLLQL